MTCIEIAIGSPYYDGKRCVGIDVHFNILISLLGGGSLSMGALMDSAGFQSFWIAIQTTDPQVCSLASVLLYQHLGCLIGCEQIMEVKTLQFAGSC